MSPLRMPAANSARAVRHQSSPRPSGSKMGPGDMNTRPSAAAGWVAKPPNGGFLACRSFSADLRSTGSLARAARELTAAGSTPSRCAAQPGALLMARRTRSGSRLNWASSRCAGSRVSSWSKCSLVIGTSSSAWPAGGGPCFPRVSIVGPGIAQSGPPPRGDGGSHLAAAAGRVLAAEELSAHPGREPMIEYGHFIGGKRVKGTSGREGNVFQPMTGEVRARVAFASKAEVAAAVDNAKAAQPAWAATNPQRRARVLMKFLELANRDYDKLADCLAREHGKTIADARGDIQRGLEVVEFAIGIPHLMKGEYTEGAGPGIDLYSMRQPLGVVAGITPFNFPAMIPLWKCAPAIACGNAFILKPSERDPGVPLMLA